MQKAPKSFADLELQVHYESDADDLLNHFYKPVLSRSVMYRRAVGYFSDSVLRACARELAEFISANGRIELIVGVFVSAEELASIEPAERTNEERRRVRAQLLAALDRLAANSGKSVAIIGDLIASGILTLKVAVRDQGIYHEKMGIFEDADGERIAFIGSANETDPALASQVNHESFSAYSSFDDYIYRRYGKALESKFDALWAGKAKSTRIYDLDEDVLAKLKALCTQVKESPATYAAQSALPPLPTAAALRPYQVEALQKWRSASYRGILAMATGTGKTITALHALQNFRQKVPAGFIIVVVPYQNLAAQWIQAISDAGIESIPAFQSFSGWYDQLQNLCLAAAMTKIKAPCIVAVADTFKSDRFQELLRIIEGAKEKNHLVIADECHHFNSSEQLSYLPDFANYRLGLSATPYDQYSQKFLESYFQDIVFEFPLGRAIQDGYLCPYEYHTLPTRLDEEETEVYEAVTRRIIQLIGADEILNPENLAKVQPLLLQRARVVGACRDKLITLKKHLSQRGPQPYSLVYCGDGSNTDDSGSRLRQIEQVSLALHELGWKVGRVTAEESLRERESLLNSLRDRSIDAIVSIRVLDEGIDIPACRTAYLLASQRSERQHIQRRGRVLRLSAGKDKAAIYDLVVVGGTTGSVAMRTLGRRELERALRFAEDSANPAGSLEEIARLAEANNISLEASI